uniref:Dynein heavy chain tail domain-containing protein n=1 Tax=Amphiprion percula TaxID=161767 RepID=A0A3P8TH40_AMPPE
MEESLVDFLREQAFCVLRVKTDKWNRFIGAEENQKIMLDFLDHIWTNSIPTVFASVKTSPPWKTKLLCVLKKGVKRIARQGFRHQLWLGEVPGYPMEHLPVVISEVLVCVLSNGLNHDNWPQVVSDDIHRHLERLRNKVVTLRGRAEGRTLLPLPLCVERARPQDIVLRSVCMCATVVTISIQWSGQIWNVLKKDSGMVLLQGDHPGPNVELQFWTTQRENLLGIQSQIQSSKVEQIIEILRRVKSSYYSAFKDVSVLEAEDIDLHLRPLRRQISNLEERSFPQVDTLLPPLFHTLCLIWCHSKYYCTPQRMVVLLQEFCNLIIEKAFAYLIPEELFKMELEEGMERVQISISVLCTFKQLFHAHRQKIPKYYRHSQNMKLWDFPASLVFKRSDCIVERLLMIEVSLDFLKLEKIELGGSRGKILSEMVFSMSEEFHDCWRTLRESKYDPLDYTNDVRPSEIVAAVFDSATLVFQLQSGCAILGKNMPSVAGNLKWSQELRSRILTDRSSLCQLAHMYGPTLPPPTIQTARICAVFFFHSILLLLPGLWDVLRQTTCSRSVNVFSRFWTSMMKSCSQSGLRGWRKSVKRTSRTHC